MSWNGEGRPSAFGLLGLLGLLVVVAMLSGCSGIGDVLERAPPTKIKLPTVTIPIPGFPVVLGGGEIETKPDRAMPRWCTGRAGEQKSCSLLYVKWARAYLYS